MLAKRFAEDRSIREVATDLGRSEGAVKQLQFRAFETLRARLGVRLCCATTSSAGIVCP